MVSDKPHFEYFPALYRVVTGRSPLEVCIPLRDIFHDKDIEVLEDSIVDVDLENKKLHGSSGSSYSFDSLVLALGSETDYFNIPGLQEFSLGFKSIQEALRLKEHLHEQFEARVASDADRDEDVNRAHIVIVGGGASGTELAGELVRYSKILAAKHEIDSSLIMIDLIEAAPRLLPAMPESVSMRVQERLHSLGVNIFLNRRVVKEEIESLYLKDMKLKTKTVIWTAGAKPNSMYSKIKGLSLDKKGRVIVDEFLQAKGFSNVFVIGDAAATPFTGMAQTAMVDGKFVAGVLGNVSSDDDSQKPYKAKKPFYAIPVGSGWAVVLIGKIRVYGKIGWLLRSVADLRYFLSVLPLSKAISAFRDGKALTESCSICDPENN